MISLCAFFILKFVSPLSKSIIFKFPSKSPRAKSLEEKEETPKEQHLLGKSWVYIDSNMSLPLVKLYICKTPLLSNDSPIVINLGLYGNQ